MIGLRGRVLALGLVALLSSSGHAEVLLPPLPETAKRPSASAVRAAERAYARAGVAFEERDHRTALAEATTAWETLPNSSTALTRAVILGELDRHAEAFAAYLVAGDLGPNTDEASLIAAGLARHGAVMDPPHGWVTVVAQPAGALVEVDGVTFAAPRVIGVSAGRHRIHLSAAGHVRSHGGFEVRAGIGQRLEYELAAAPPPVVVEAPAPIVIKPDKPPQPRIIEWVLVGAGGAALIVGGVFHASALDAADDTKRYASPGAAGLEDDSRRLLHSAAMDDAESGRISAGALYGLGGALAITGVVLLLTDDDAAATDPDPPADATAVSVGPLGVTLSGGF